MSTLADCLEITMKETGIAGCVSIPLAGKTRGGAGRSLLGVEGEERALEGPFRAPVVVFVVSVEGRTVGVGLNGSSSGCTRIPFGLNLVGGDGSEPFGYAVASLPFATVYPGLDGYPVALLEGLAFFDIVLGELNGDGVVPFSVAGFNHDLLLSESVGSVFADFVHELDFSLDGDFVHYVFFAKMNGWIRSLVRLGKAKKETTIWLLTEQFALGE